LVDLPSAIWEMWQSS